MTLLHRTLVTGVLMFDEDTRYCRYVSIPFQAFMLRFIDKLNINVYVNP